MNMKCPKNKRCSKQEYLFDFDGSPICKKCDEGKDIKDKSSPVNIMTDSLSAVLNKNLTAKQKKILKRNDQFIHNIEKAHKDAGKSKLIFKEKK